MALSLVLSACSDEEVAVEYQSYAVERGNLRITIRQKGTIEARDPLRVTNPIRGSTMLLDIVQEGSLVKKGDWLFELDVQDQRDQLLQQEIETSSAAQKLLNAEQQLEIQLQQNDSNIKEFEFAILLAGLDLKQYLEAELPRERETILAEITLAEEELNRAQQALSSSLKLEDKGYISGDQIESNRLEVKRHRIEIDLARKKLVILDEYTVAKQRQKLEAGVEQARLELGRIEARARAAENKARADVEAHAAQLALEQRKLARLRRQVDNNVAYAPRDGIVVYGREGRGRRGKPLEPGSNVREGQTVVTIPDLNHVLVDVDVHESSIELVKLGQPVTITTDTGETLEGTIEHVAALADTQVWWLNPDLKVYSTKVTVDNSRGKLRPGMTCYADILVHELKDILSIPVQAVFSNGAGEFVYIKAPDGAPVLREIRTGLNNDFLVQVVDGLEEKEEVFLARPPEASPLPDPPTSHKSALADWESAAQLNLSDAARAAEQRHSNTER